MSAHDLTHVSLESTFLHPEGLKPLCDFLVAHLSGSVEPIATIDSYCQTTTDE